MKRGYVKVKISRELAAKLDEVALRLGYRDRDEVVGDAVGRFVESLGLIPEESGRARRG
ncbi:MAG: hypothetical protein JRM73_00205 [Nitrososphaerota archaeon]|nr:hypothetical protein [Nitrososphaerota archaeon]